MQYGNAVENYALAGLGKKNTPKQMDGLKPAERIIYEKYVKELDAMRLQMDDFKDLFGAGLERDKRALAKMKEREDDGTERGKLLEAVFFKNAESSNWFGENSYVIALSEYDDRVAKSDLLLELEDKNGDVVRILIDLTTSVFDGKIKEKMGTSLEGVGNGKLGSVKYFRSEWDSSCMGEIEGLPRVVLGIDPQTLGEFCAEINIDKKRQENNPIQLMFLDEMENQLIYMLATARKIHGDNHKVTIELARSLEAVKDVLNKKESLRTHDYETKASADKTYQLLQNA